MGRSSAITEDEEMIQPTVSKSDDERNNDDALSDEEGRKRKAESSSAQMKDKRKRVMQQSGQTDAERRQIRNNQRELQRKILENGDDITNINSDAFETIHEQNNALWKNVYYVREAVLDGENMEYIGAKVTRQVDALIQVPRYDADHLVHKLRLKCSLQTTSGSSVFDWKTFGIECGSCYNAVPPQVYFLAGPIHTSFTPKEKKKIVRKPKVVDEAEEETAEDLKQTKGSNKDSNSLSAAQKRMHEVVKLLYKRCKDEKNSTTVKLQAKGTEIPTEEQKTSARNRAEKYGDRVCAVQFLFNPKSFTQTVENIFAVSFLVKEGQAEIGVRDEHECAKHHWDDAVVPGPWIRSLKDAESINNGTHTEARQAVVRLNMKDWKKMCSAFEIEASDIPDRTTCNSVKSSK